MPESAGVPAERIGVLVEKTRENRLGDIAADKYGLLASARRLPEFRGDYHDV